MTVVEPPSGFAPFPFASPFLDLIGPIYSKPNDAGITIGFRIEDRHCNRRGTVHGGVLASVADVTLGYSAAFGQIDLQLTTVALNIEYLGPAGAGGWIECAGSVTKLGRSIAHTLCVITSEERDVARAVGMFLVHRPPRPPAPRSQIQSANEEDGRTDDNGF